MRMDVIKYLVVAAICCVSFIDGLAADSKGSQVVPIPESEVMKYPDSRPAARYRLDAKDQGVILKHGDGPGQCDILGAREALIFEENGTYHLLVKYHEPDWYQN